MWRRGRCLGISAALVSNNFSWLRTPGVICTTFSGSGNIKPSQLRWLLKVEILGEQGPQSHLKKWNSGVRLEKGVWQIAVPCKHQDKATTQSRSMCGPHCRRKGPFSEASAIMKEYWGGGLPRLEVAQLTCTSMKGPTGLGQPPTAGALLPILIHSKSILFAHTARLLQSPLLPFHAIK